MSVVLSSAVSCRDVVLVLPGPGLGPSEVISSLNKNPVFCTETTEDWILWSLWWCPGSRLQVISPPRLTDWMTGGGWAW